MYSSMVIVKAHRLRPNFILRILILRIIGANFPGDSLETEDFYPLKIRIWAESNLLKINS